MADGGGDGVDGDSSENGNGNGGDGVGMMNGGPVAAHMASFGRIRDLVFGSYGERSEDVDDVVRTCAKAIADKQWQISGMASPNEAYGLFKNYIFKKLAILSLKSVADLLYNRREALGSDDGGESQIAMKDVLAQMDAAQLEHADIHAGLRR